MRALALVLLLLALPAAAEEDPSMTRLFLTETALRAVPDDRYVALLEGRAEAADAAAAQAALNGQMQAALDAVAAVDGLVATTHGYEVRERERDDAPTTWIASQSLRLETADRALLLERVGALQAMGLVTRQLGSELSRSAHDALRDDLLAEAIAGLRRQAETAAHHLGLRVLGYAELRVDGVRPVPMPRAMMAEAMAAAPPVMTAGTSEVAVSVAATALLGP